VRCLHERYADARDPIVAATPVFYQQAIRARLRDLLASTSVPAVIR
jgi:hypothetical protein